MVIVKTKDSLRDTDRDIRNEHYTTTRFLLEEDGLDVTVTDIAIHAGSDAVYHYPEHTEICYCLEGEGELTDLDNGGGHRIAPGSMWVSADHKPFRFVALTNVRLICVFRPALKSHELGFAKADV